jgi:drug/metabolite transporter (DMT)-like permease
MLGEPITTIQIAGAILVLAGVLLVGLKVETVTART